ncbi:MAG: DUF4263 domain-containing protein [Gammaproteobacteria bacterium]|nr:DUF4263 domain-containing protein [Gammaproteobacteria bacterium]
MSDSDNYENPKEGKTYISPSLTSFGDDSRQIRIATKLIQSPTSYAFAKIKDELVLRHKDDAKSIITAKFFEDDRGLFVLSIQGYTVATEKPHNSSFSFIGEEIDKLIEFLNNIHLVQLKSRGRVDVTDEEIQNLVVSSNQAKRLLHENREIFTEILKSEVTKEDVVAVGYRKKQLEVYKQLLESEDYFAKLRVQYETTAEGLWQKYFEKNPWVFGYGLGYIFLSSLDDKKLEQVVKGHNVSSYGKRVDALMKTRGIISNLCFVEIKTHKTALLEKTAYRAGCFAPSKELAGAVAQVQGTVADAVETLTSKISMTEADGYLTGEDIFNYQPKSYLVIGDLSEFTNEHGINSEKYRSFELYRKNTTNPEIITFDELHERSKYIVHHNES